MDRVRVGCVPRSVNDLFGKVRRKESSALCLMERALREATVDGEWHYLGRLITPMLSEEIQTYALRHRP